MYLPKTVESSRKREKMLLNELSLYSQGKIIDQQSVELLPELVEPWFIFSLVWSIGATCNQDGRKKFSNFLREQMKNEKVNCCSLS